GLDRADPQAGNGGLRQDLLEHREKRSLWVEIAPVAPEVDPREHNFLVALALEITYLPDDTVRSQTATGAANVRNDAERTARVAAVKAADHAAHLGVRHRRHRTRVEHRHVAGLGARSLLEPGLEQLSLQRGAVRLAGSASEIEKVKSSHQTMMPTWPYNPF